MKTRFKDWLQKIQESLLNDTVTHNGNPQRALAAVSFGNHHPENRGWFEGSGFKLLMNILKVNLKIFAEIKHRHPVNAGSAFVGPD